MKMGKIYRNSYGNLKLADNKPKIIKGAFGITFTSQEVEDIFIRSKGLKRVRISGESKIEGDSEAGIQKTKTDLDTLLVAGIKEKQARKELERLFTI